MNELICFMSRKAGLVAMLAACSATALGCATTDPALVDEIAGLREEVRTLRAEIQELKKPLVLAEPLTIQLPQSTAASPEGPALVVSILADGKLMLGERVVSREELQARLGKRAGQDPQARVLIRADDKVRYEQVAGIMELIKAAGIDRIGIATGEK